MGKISIFSFKKRRPERSMSFLSNDKKRESREVSERGRVVTGDKNNEGNVKNTSVETTNATKRKSDLVQSLANTVIVEEKVVKPNEGDPVMKARGGIDIQKQAISASDWTSLAKRMSSNVAGVSTTVTEEAVELSTHEGIKSLLNDLSDSEGGNILNSRRNPVSTNQNGPSDPKRDTLNAHQNLLGSKRRAQSEREVRPVTRSSNSLEANESLTLRSILSGDFTGSFFDSIWQERCALFPREEKNSKAMDDSSFASDSPWNEERMRTAPFEELIQQGWFVMLNLLEQSAVNPLKNTDWNHNSIEKAPPLFFKYQKLVAPTTHATFSTDLFKAYLDGCSIVLNHADLHSPWIASICEDLQRSFPHVYANAFISPPESQILSAHAADRDLFIIQVTGAKRWKVYEKVPIKYPGPNEQVGKDGLGVPNDVLQGAVLVDAVLQPGDVLYLPRGYVHEAQGLASGFHPSFHVTIALATHDWTFASAITKATENILTSVMDLRKAVPRSIGRVDMTQIGAGEKKEVEKKVESALQVLKEQLTIQEIATIMEQKYNMYNSEAFTGRQHQIEQAKYLRSREVVTNDIVGAAAAKMITLSTVVRGATLREKHAAQSLLSVEIRGLQVRQEIASGIFNIITQLKNNPGLHYRVRDLRVLLNADHSESNLICDLTLLSFVKQCVEQGALAVAGNMRWPSEEDEMLRRQNLQQNQFTMM